MTSISRTCPTTTPCVFYAKSSKNPGPFSSFINSPWSQKNTALPGFTETELLLLWNMDPSGVEPIYPKVYFHRLFARVNQNVILESTETSMMACRYLGQAYRRSSDWSIFFGTTDRSNWWWPSAGTRTPRATSRSRARNQCDPSTPARGWPTLKPHEVSGHFIELWLEWIPLFLDAHCTIAQCILKDETLMEPNDWLQEESIPTDRPRSRPWRRPRHLWCRA